MKPIIRTLPLTMLLLAGCTYGIRLDPGGQHVRIAWNGNVGIRACRDIGKVTVSVLDHVGPVDRSDTKIREELGIMARNQAATMGADTITPLGDPRNGEQSFEAWDCGSPPPRASSQGNMQGSGAPVVDIPTDNAQPATTHNQSIPADSPNPPSSDGAQTYPISSSSH